MSIVPVLIVLFGLGFGGIAIGGYVNFRSVRSGRGPSPTGIAIQVAAIVLVLISVSLTFLIAIAKSELWPVTILLIPILLFAIILMIGAIQGLRGRRRP